jgi:hypothetical protein
MGGAEPGLVRAADAINTIGHISMRALAGLSTAAYTELGI